SRAAGPWISAADSARCSGARSGSARIRATSATRTWRSRASSRASVRSSAGAWLIFHRGYPRTVRVMAKWWTLLAVCLATFMLLLDVTIVNVALPSIERALDASFSDLQWVVDAYALTLAAFLLTAGSIADLMGRRLGFLGALGVFSVASLTSGLAWDPLVLNISRAAQGVGAAMMFATSLALLAQAFQGKERGTAFGIWGATTGAAVTIGPLAGGLLTDYLGWEWIFFINV